MKTSTRAVLTATGSAAMLLLGQSAHANTLVASIIGAYDAVCYSTCAGVEGGGVTSYYNSGEGADDTPSLFILNPTASSFTNVTLTFKGYQDVAGNGGSGASFQGGASAPSVQTLTLNDIPAHTAFQLIWNGTNGVAVVGSASGNNLFANDYDDELGDSVPYGDTPANVRYYQPGGFGLPDGTWHDASGNSCNEPGGSAQSGICSYVGNFSVDFEATWNNGTSNVAISSVFSNYAVVTNDFVGWEGLDPDGLSETKYDNHGGTFPGTLADIFTGSHVVGGGSPVPEPGTLAILAASLGAVGMIRRRRKAGAGA